MKKEVLVDKENSSVDSQSKAFVPFNKVYLSGGELANFEKVLESRELAGNGQFTKKVHGWLETKLGTQAAFLTGAGTLALEMAAMLLSLEPGDEVIMPSFTFVTTASSFVRAGLVPRFVDICPETLNIDVEQIKAAITSKTKAIVPVHYAGVAAQMDEILEIARDNNLKVVEDAAHGILAKYGDDFLGTIAPLAVLSFHETKNIVGGEGGALLVNDPALIPKARQLWLKGTNKLDMDLGLVGKYTWTELGSSFAASELQAAVISAQLEVAEKIFSMRTKVWSNYHELLAGLETKGYLRRPIVPDNCQQNGHIYYFLTESQKVRDELLSYLKQENIESVFHYIPLHNSPAGKKFGKTYGELIQTQDISGRLVRLPMWAELDRETQVRIVDSIEMFFKDC